MKHAIKSFALAIVVAMLFAGCTANKNLSHNDVVRTAPMKYPGLEMNISTVPSRGPPADAMAISAIKTVRNDEGFSKEFATFIKSDPKNELKGISVCVIGIANSQELTTEAVRTGAVLTFIP